MILTAKFEGFDGVESVHPTNYGIVVEVSDLTELDEWLSENPYYRTDDVHDEEVKQAIQRSVDGVPFDSEHDLYRILREPSDSDKESE